MDGMYDPVWAEEVTKLRAELAQFKSAAEALNTEVEYFRKALAAERKAVEWAADEMVELDMTSGLFLARTADEIREKAKEGK